MLHVAEVSNFHNSIEGYLNDKASLLELYKASKLGISENESILDNIGKWSGSLLMNLPLDEVQRISISREVVTRHIKISFNLWFTLCISLCSIISDRACS